MAKQDIKNFTIEELREEIAKMGEPPYRATQVFRWIYHNGLCDFERMNNISSSLKRKLKERYHIGENELFRRFKSPDGSEKLVFKLTDGNFTESVLIQREAGKTLCLSTQVGCKFHCAFCASGQKGFVRNLEASEILGQALFIRHESEINVTNYVFMGMGEPLDNRANLLRAIAIMNDMSGLGVAARRITISTCGIIPGIERISKDFKLQVNLSVSLNAVNNKLRDELMPVNKLYPLEKLISACKKYADNKGRLITFEYILIKGKNDSLNDAESLARIAKPLRAKVNLIPYNFVGKLPFEPPDSSQIKSFRDTLKAKKINVTLRRSGGRSIGAACGQLAGLAKESV